MNALKNLDISGLLTQCGIRKDSRTIAGESSGSRRSALDAGISAQCILMDTWFTNEPFIKNILSEGLDVIGMLKNNKQMYHYKGKLYNLDSLASCFAKMSTPGDILGSAVVKTRYEHISVKIVFVRNRNKKSEYIMILSTDCSLSDAEIIRRYGYKISNAVSKSANRY